MIYPANYSFLGYGGVVFSLEGIDVIETNHFRDRIRFLFVNLIKNIQEGNLEVELNISQFSDLLSILQLGQLQNFAEMVRRSIVIHLNPHVISENDLQFGNIIKEEGGQYKLCIGAVNIYVDITTDEGEQYKNIYLLIPPDGNRIQYFFKKDDIKIENPFFITCDRFNPNN